MIKLELKCPGCGAVIQSDDPSKSGYINKNVLEKRKDNTSLLDVEIETGKTHQIRAHLAYLGFPIIGDGKYGKNDINKSFKKSRQMLCSYKLRFAFSLPNFKKAESFAPLKLLIPVNSHIPSKRLVFPCAFSPQITFISSKESISIFSRFLKSRQE